MHLWKINLLLISFLSTQLAFADNKVSGKYELVRHGSISTVTVAQREKITSVVLEGGADGSDGASVSADCEIHAEGSLNGNNSLRAKFVPFQSDISEYTEHDAKEKSRFVDVKFAKDKLQIINADIEGFCGLRSNFQGTYKRSPSKR